MNISYKIDNIIIKILSIIQKRRKQKAEKKLKKKLNNYFDKVINQRIKTMSEIDKRRFKKEFINLMQKFGK